MTINPISVIECLVDDYGWEFVIDGLMEMAATASDERLDELGARAPGLHVTFRDDGTGG